MPIRKEFAPEQINKIIALYGDKLSLSRIGAQFDVSKTLIRRILKENNIKIRTSAESLIGKPSKQKGIPKSEKHKKNLSYSKKFKLLDGTWYPCIPVICDCPDLNCREIVYGNHNFLVGHQFRGILKSDEWKQQQSERMLSGENHFRGKSLTEEHKNNLSESLKGINTWSKGRKRTEEEIEKQKQNCLRGEDHPKPWLGKYLTQEHKDKISDNSPHLSGKDHPMYGIKGDKHWHWKGGITLLQETIRHCDKNKNWIKLVLKRDSYICQECDKSSGGNLIAHHLKQFSEILYENKITSLEQALNCQELWDISNGKTLCKECHDKIPIIK